MCSADSTSFQLMSWLQVPSDASGQQCHDLLSGGRSWRTVLPFSWQSARAPALSLAALVRCCMAAAAASLTPRLAVLILVALVSLAANARALAIIARPSQVLYSQQASLSIQCVVIS